MCCCIPPTGATLLFLLAPLLVAVAISVSEGPFASFPPRGFTLHWYGDVLTDPDFLAAAGLSLGLAFAATASALLLGIPAALALERSALPGTALLQALLLSPLVFPVLITGLALLFCSSTPRSVCSARCGTCSSPTP